MSTYKITATRVDSNGVRVGSSNAETLGDAYGVSYATRAEAEAVAAELDADKASYDMADAKFEVVAE